MSSVQQNGPAPASTAPASTAPVSTAPVSTAPAGRPRLAVLGLGGMGEAMALRLCERDFAVAVFNRTASKAAGTVAAGARAAANPAAAVEGADVVLVSLAEQLAVESVLFEQALPALAAGTVVIDTSTVSPEYARQADRRLTEAGCHRIEACLLGNPVQARSGAMRVLTAGDPADVERARPVLRTIGRQLIHVGGPGLAATMKLAFNLLLGAQVASLAEAVSYGVAAGLDREMLLSNIAESGFSSLVMSFRAEIMRERRYQPPAFRTTLMAKDLRLALSDAAEHSLAMPVTALVAGEFARVQAAGGADDDAAVLVEHPHPLA